MQRVKPLFRVLSLFLCLCLLIMSCFVPYAEAVFIESAAVAYAYELIAAALVAGGIVVANSDELISVSAAVYKWAKDKADPLCDTLMGIARQALSFAGDITTTAWRMSTQAWDAICDALVSLGFVGGSGAVISGYTYMTISNVARSAWSPAESAFITQLGNVDRPCTSIVVDGVVYSIALMTSAMDGTACPNGIPVLFVDGKATYDWGSRYASRVYEYLDLTFDWSSNIDRDVLNITIPFHYREQAGGTVYSSSLTSPLRGLKGEHTIGISNSIPVSGDLTYTGDQSLVLAPPLPTTTADPDTGKEVVVFPPLSVYPDDWTADWPKTDTGEQVDVPTDTLVDVGTGEAVGEGEIPDVGTDTGKGILDAIKNFFDSPSDFKLNFDAFKNVILTDRFPFCIPFDFVRCIKVWGIAAADYHLRIDLDTTYMSIHQDIDLTPFSLPIAFFRYGATVWFAISLILKTREMIKW